MFTISDIVKMVNLKLTLLVCVAVMLPFSQALKCIQCKSTDGSSKECDEATTEATECTDSKHVCYSSYTTEGKIMERSCQDPTKVTEMVTAQASKGKAET